MIEALGVLSLVDKRHGEYPGPIAGHLAVPSAVSIPSSPHLPRAGFRKAHLKQLAAAVRQFYSTRDPPSARNRPRDFQQVIKTCNASRRRFRNSCPPDHDVGGDFP